MKYNKLKLLKNAFTVFLVWLLINVPVYAKLPTIKENGKLIIEYYKTHDFGDNLEMDFFFISLIIVSAIILWNLIQKMLKDK